MQYFIGNLYLRMIFLRFSYVLDLRWLPLPDSVNKKLLSGLFFPGKLAYISINIAHVFFSNFFFLLYHKHLHFGYASYIRRILDKPTGSHHSKFSSAYLISTVVYGFFFPAFFAFAKWRWLKTLGKFAYYKPVTLLIHRSPRLFSLGHA